LLAPHEECENVTNIFLFIFFPNSQNFRERGERERREREERERERERKRERERERQRKREREREERERERGKKLFTKSYLLFHLPLRLHYKYLFERRNSFCQSQKADSTKLFVNSNLYLQVHSWQILLQGSQP
jgi:hypothetical protein